eukprot:m.55690 g.55690  ORF g.55690 m.55690 type:complete len:452 (-) comp7764_c0_seq1:174-1529(-)
MSLTAVVSRSNTASSTSSPHSFTVVHSLEGNSQLEVVPGRGVGEFVLGTSINDMIAFLSSHYDKYSKVKLIYNDKDPFDEDIILDISDVCIQLRFDPVMQCLKAAEIYSFEHIRLEYGKAGFGGSEELDYTFAHVENVFGVTRAEYIHKKGSYILDYPGLSLGFEVPSTLQKNYLRHQNDLAQERVFCDGTAALLTSLCVFSGQSKSPTVSTAQVELNAGAFFHECVDIHVGKGITFTKRKISISFGDSTQDVLTTLGRPGDIFYKSENKMKIFRGTDASSPYTDYFFNYPSIGIDILFDGRTQHVKKFLLHNNLPNHMEFGEYARCNFNLILEPSSQPFPQQQQPMGEESVVSEQPRGIEDAFANVHIGIGEISRKCQDPIAVKPSTMWRDIRRVLGTHTGKEVVFNKPLEDGTVNPFGPTALWGSHGVIFEVTCTGHIATLTLFETDNA